MAGIDWIVVLAAAGMIGWVNWYFFIAGRSRAVPVDAMSAGAASGGSTDAGPAAMPQVTIVVDGGYAPSTIRVRAGMPIRLVFDRRDTSGCSEEVVFPDFGIRRYLPTGKKTAIEVTPPTAGKYGFMCGMSMLRGTLIAET